MTNNNRTYWTDDRLDRLAEIVEANSRGTAELREIVAPNSRGIAELREIVATNSRETAELREIVATNSKDIAALRENIAQLASIAQIQQQTLTRTAEVLVQEIRGLRAENRRILTHLFGEQPPQQE